MKKTEYKGSGKITDENQLFERTVKRMLEMPPKPVKQKEKGEKAQKRG